MKDKGITNGKNRNIVAEELNVDMGDKLVGKHEHCYVENEFKDNQRADKK